MKGSIKEAQADLRMKETRLHKLEKQAAEAKDFQERERFEKEARDLARSLADEVIPTSPCYLADDITPEKLGTLMTDNEERMAIISAEGGLFEILAGLYSNTGVSNIDLFLKAWDGGSWSNHRVGRDDKSMVNPLLTLCLSVQPVIIGEIGKNRQFDGRGLLARFLYAVCKSQVGYRERQTTSVPSPLSIKYETHIFSLLQIMERNRLLTLSPEAQAEWDAFYNEIEHDMRPDGSLYNLQEWGSKLAGEVARIAGLLHMAEHGAQALSIPISVNSVRAACEIGWYLKEHALVVFGLMQEDKGMKVARQILDCLKRHNMQTFKGRDIMQNTSIKNMDEVMQGVKVLLERDYVREEAKSEQKRMGRPGSQQYGVNPKAIEEG
jgi:hypothetical protein